MKNLVLPIILLLTLIGVFVYLNSSTKVDNSSVEPSALVMETSTDPDAAMKDKAITDEVSSANGSGSTSAEYVNYSESVLASSHEKDRSVVLFFHAAWCPTCRAAENEILRNLESLPKNLTILKVDYDNEKELRRKYQVTLQHTFVQVVEDGSSITKWVGGNSAEIVENLKSM